MRLQSQQKAAPVQLSGDNNHRFPSLERGPREPSEVIQKAGIVRIEPHLMAADDFYGLLSQWCDNLIASSATGGPQVRRPRETMAGKSAPHKPLTPQNSFHGDQQFASRIHLHDVPRSAHTESRLRDIHGRFLADKQYFGLRGNRTDSPRGFDSVDLRESNIHQDQVRLHRLRHLDGFHPIRRFDDGQQFQLVLKGRIDEPPKRFEIICYQDPG
jgi:hypothetical protein